MTGCRPPWHSGPAPCFRSVHDRGCYWRLQLSLPFELLLVRTLYAIFCTTILTPIPSLNLNIGTTDHAVDTRLLTFFTHEKSRCLWPNACARSTSWKCLEVDGFRAEPCYGRHWTIPLVEVELSVGPKMRYQDQPTLDVRPQRSCSPFKSVFHLS